jgi:hypothetical protein
LDTEQEARPIQSSLLAAARDLQASAHDYGQAAAAARQAATAVEFHLDTLVQELARSAVEPRLRGRAEAVESRLRTSLAGIWASERELRSGELHPARLEASGETLRDIAEDEIDLVFEGLRETPSLD